MEALNDTAAANEPAVDHVVRKLTARSGSMTMAELGELADWLSRVRSRWVGKAREPLGQKAAPRFNATQLAELCGKTVDQMSTLLKRAPELGLPAGEAAEKNKPRYFSLAEARQWVRHVARWPGRPQGRDAATICICNFKGGVSKTISAVSLAQGLTLRGYRVLAIDFDPQGSLTSILGREPTTLDPEETIVPLTYPPGTPGATDSLVNTPRPTYWDGLDLIPANRALFVGEFYLPMRQTARKEKDFMFWEILNKALQELRPKYDYIIIDTPPALSYLTLTTFWAADALLMPLPPEGMDFDSSIQFWNMLSEIATGTAGSAGAEKAFKWVRIVPSKVDPTKMHTDAMRELIELGYQGMLAATAIPETAAVRVAGAKLETVYDIERYMGDRRTLLRAREAFDKLIDEVDTLTHKNIWN